ncbi:MAG: SDR family oxidoreductase, partial [Myxococcota bacterium]|nr:SDR family oxidoreductase [Myxococcota bacterium]
LLHGSPAADRARGAAWEDPGGLEALAAALRDAGGRVACVEADLARAEAPARLVEEARRHLGRLDVVVAGHAYWSGQGVDTLTAEDLDRHLAVNVRATLLLVSAFARGHDGAPGGRVVLLLSGTHRGPMTGELGYVAGKGALHQLVPSLAAELAPRRITVNGVNPGPTDTGWVSERLRPELLRRAPMGRVGEPDDAARLVAWLVSDEAAWITGQVIDSEGGFVRG